jgi:hypothetical protein
LKGITEEYQIAYIELDEELEVDRVCDIFTQVNSRGVRLDSFDLINAMLKPKGLQLKSMYREAELRLNFVDTDRMNVYTLQVMSILKQAYCSPKYLYFLVPGKEKPIREPDGTRRREVLLKDISEFSRLWDVSVKAIEESIELLRHPQEFGAISSKYLPYVTIIPVFAAMQEMVRNLPPNRQLDARRKIRHWYWASVFTNRYSGSVESTSARDYIDLQTWIHDEESAPILLQEFKARFRNLNLRNEVRSGTTVYNGVFNLLVMQGARDWMTGFVPQHNDLDDHHIVPASWGATHLKGGLVNSILNRTPLTAATNRHVIGDQLPNVYLPELIAQNGGAVVRRIMKSHLISPLGLNILLRDPFTPDGFEEFIVERQRTIQDAIENLLIKERVDLTPQLRELDDKIERVELGLRQLVVRSLEEDPEQLPPHVA